MIEYQILDDILNQACEELIGAKYYYELYEKYKKDFPSLSKVFLDISPIELTHFEKLVSATDNFIESFKDTNKEINIIWEHDKSRLIKYSKEIKNEIMQNRY